MSEFLRRLKFLFHRDRFERELDEEMRRHLAFKEQAPYRSATSHF
jgi:hypothetical protein